MAFPASRSREIANENLALAQHRYFSLLASGHCGYFKIALCLSQWKHDINKVLNYYTITYCQLPS
jgi:hypothetical protein